MLKEVLEGDYLLQFAFINYVSPDTVFPKLQQTKILQRKRIKIKIYLNIIELLYVMMVCQISNSNRMAKNLPILCEWKKDINLLEFLKQIYC